MDDTNSTYLIERYITVSNEVQQIITTIKPDMEKHFKNMQITRYTTSGAQVVGGSLLVAGFLAFPPLIVAGGAIGSMGVVSHCGAEGVSFAYQTLYINKLQNKMSQIQDILNNFQEIVQKSLIDIISDKLNYGIQQYDIIVQNVCHQVNQYHKLIQEAIKKQNGSHLQHILITFETILKNTYENTIQTFKQTNEEIKTAIVQNSQSVYDYLQKGLSTGFLFNLVGVIMILNGSINIITTKYNKLEHQKLYHTILKIEKSLFNKEEQSKKELKTFFQSISY